MSRGTRSNWRLAATTLLFGAAAVATILYLRRETGLAQAERRAAVGDWKKAAELARPLAVGWFRSERALRLLAEAASREGDMPAAEQALAALPHPTAADRVAHAKLLTGFGRPAEAAAEWTRFAAESRQAQDELLAFYKFLFDAKRADQANDLRRALADRPEGAFPASDALLAADLMHLGFPREASRRFERVLEHFKAPTVALRFQAANALLAADSAARAEQILNDAAPTSDDEKAERFWLLSRVALQQRNPPAAASWLAQLRSLGPASAPFAAGSRAESAPPVGSQACARCHQANFAAQRTSHHAQTFAVADARLHLTADQPDPLDPSVRYTLSSHHDGLDVLAARAGNVLGQGRVDWALGSGTRGRSFLVTSKSGREIELGISQYPGHGWDATTGQLKQFDRADPLGRVLTDTQADQCIGCHQTDVESARAARPRLAAAPGDLPPRLAEDLGVRCESCHGAGGNHVRAAELNFKQDWAIRNPARLSAAASVEICARCHQPNTAVDLSGGDSVRFQTAGLRESKCFQASGKLSCVTCHNPHTTARRPAADYGRRCLQCHERQSLPCPPLANTRPKQASEAEAASCTNCHMPATAGAMKHTVFADHRIRVHREPPGAAKSPELNRNGL